MYDGANLPEQLDNARLVRNSKTLPVTFAWFGGHGMHGYLANGREVAFWNVGDFAEYGIPLELAERELDEAANVQDWQDVPGIAYDWPELARFLTEAAT